MRLAPSLSKGTQRILRSHFKRETGRIYSPADVEFMTRASLDTAVFSRLDVKPRTRGSGVAELPIDLRIYNGGATSVRSFPERELGPRSRAGRTPLGGLTSQTASAELSYELVPSLELALFGDAGNLSNSDLRYAIGLGLRYKLPMARCASTTATTPSAKTPSPQERCTSLSGSLSKNAAFALHHCKVTQRSLSKNARAWAAIWRSVSLSAVSSFTVRPLGCLCSRRLLSSPFASPGPKMSSDSIW